MNPFVIEYESTVVRFCSLRHHHRRVMLRMTGGLAYAICEHGLIRKLCVVTICCYRQISGDVR